MNDVELPLPSDPFPDRLLAEVVLIGRKGGQKAGDVRLTYLGDHINIVRQTWLAVSHGGHRARHDVENTEPLKGLNHARQQIIQLHATFSAPLRG